MIRRLIALTLLATAGAAEEMYRVAGVVVNASTNTPLAHARVLLLKTQSPEVVASMVTGDDGHFSFDVPRGKFRLTAGSRTAVNSFGLRRSDSGFGTAVVTGPGQDTGGMVFRWFPPGGISGRVVDQNGEPVESAIVHLIFSRVIAGRRTLSSWSFARTDDRGDYHFGPLRGGTYYLAISGEPWQSSRRYGSTDAGPPTAYAPVYSGNTNDLSRAAPVVIQPGEQLRADFTLAAVPGSTLVIRHDAPPEMRGTVSLLMDSMGTSEGYQRSETMPRYGQELRLAGVPPGRYVLRLRGSTATQEMAAEREILVGGIDASVDLHVQPIANLSGRVELENPKGARRGSLYVRLTADGRTTLQTLVRPDGSFSFAVANGKYRPSVTSIDGHFATQIRVDGAEYRGGEIEVREGMSITVNIMASDATGTVKGFVMDGERPLEGAMVVLARATDSTDPYGSLGFQTDSDGSFEFRNVPPADYVLFSVTDTEIEYASPEAVQPYRATAKPVRVERRGVSEHRIAITPAPPK